MNRRTIKVCCLLLTAMMILSISLPGCSAPETPPNILPNEKESTLSENKSETAETEIPVLKVVVEEFPDSLKQLNTQFSYVVSQFWKSKDMKVKVEVEYLPVVGRSAALERIRTSLMAGEGPDVLILPTNSSMDIDDESIQLNELLIPDVNQAMHNGLFSDISELYDADTELNKEALVTTVMDAGVINEARYTLPLFYNFPVAFVDMDQFAETGLSTEVFDSGILSLTDAIVQSGNQKLAGCACPAYFSEYILNFFPNLLDYSEQEVLITKEEVSTYLESMQRFELLRNNTWGGGYPYYIQEYINQEGKSFWATEGYCFHLADLCSVFESTLYSNAEDVNLEMFPIRGLDGSLVADVTYYGAISAGCENKELAYEFLRMFLMEDFQWGQEYIANIHDLFDDAGISIGWPVRAENALQVSCDGFYKSLQRYSADGPVERKQRKERLLETSIVEDELSILKVNIDKARYPIEALEEKLFRIVWDDLIERGQNKVSSNDIGDLADEWLHDLEWHMFEG